MLKYIKFINKADNYLFIKQLNYEFKYINKEEKAPFFFFFSQQKLMYQIYCSSSSSSLLFIHYYMFHIMDIVYNNLLNLYCYY